MGSPADRDQMREIMRGVALISQVGLTMVGCILAGAFLGYKIADYAGALFGLLVGIAAGFYNCYRLLTRTGGLISKGGDKDGGCSGKSEDSEK